MDHENEFALTRLYEAEVLKEIRTVLNIITNSMAIPLYLIFWVADLIYIPDRKWEFLLLRMTIIPICLVTRYESKKELTSYQAQILCVTFVGLVALPINIMIFLIPEVGTGYYAGLNLVAIGGLSFIPFSLNFFLAATFTIYFPYYSIALGKSQGMHDLLEVLLNSFFIVGAIIICFVIRLNHERFRLRDINNTLALNARNLNEE